MRQAMLVLVAGFTLCCGKEVDPEASTCTDAINTVAWSYPDLLSNAAPKELAPGSAAAPLPLKNAVESAFPCVDDLGSVWAFNDEMLVRYDAKLIPLELFDVSGALVCGDTGALLIHSNPAGNLGFTIERYQANQGKTGEWSFAEGRALSIGAVSHRDGWTVVPTSEGTFRIDPQMTATEQLLNTNGAVLGPGGILTRVTYEPTTLTLEIAPPGSDFEVRGTLTTQLRGYLRFFGVGSEQQVYIAVDGYLSSSRGDDVATTGITILAFDEQGHPLWQREFASPGRMHSDSLEVTSEGEIWFTGELEEWARVGTNVVSGHYVTSKYGSWTHRFLCVLDAKGEVTRLFPLGETEYVPTPAHILSVTPDMGVFISTATAQDTFGEDGALPKFTPFIASLNLPDTPPQKLPEQPKEKLIRAEPAEPPSDEATVDRVYQSDDGSLYLYAEKNDKLQLMRYSDHHALPVFERPEPLSRGFQFALYKEQLFWFEYGETFEQLPASLGVYEVQGDVWHKVQDLAFDLRYSDQPVSYYGTLLVSSDWLFLGGFEIVQAYPRNGNIWGSPIQAFAGSGRSLARMGDRLFVGAPDLAGERQSEGGVWEVRIHENRLDRGALIKASDNLPFEPAMPPSGDVVFQPPPGKAFGVTVQAHGSQVIVSNAEGQVYFFNETAEGWREEPPLQLNGDPFMLSDTQMVVSRPGEDRGVTRGSGALHIYQKRAGSWQEWKRVVPTQRWESRFGASLGRSDDTLLVGATGYGSAQPTQAGAVFEIPLIDCSD